WRGREGTEADPVVTAPAATRAGRRDGASRATVLILVRESDAVPRAHLCGQFDREDVPTIRATPFDGRILLVVPVGCIPGVEVREDAFGVCGASKIACRAEEPQPVTHDRPPERTADIVLVEQCRRPRQADAAQVVIDVVRPQRVAGAAIERAAVETVSARSRDQVDARPTRFAFTKPD